MQASHRHDLEFKLSERPGTSPHCPRWRLSHEGHVRRDGRTRGRRERPVQVRDAKCSFNVVFVHVLIEHNTATTVMLLVICLLLLLLLIDYLLINYYHTGTADSKVIMITNNELI